MKPKTVKSSKKSMEAQANSIKEARDKLEGSRKQATIARLKAASEFEAKRNYKEGHKAGKVWAEETAMPSHLETLFELDNDWQYGLEGTLDLYNNGLNHGIAVGLHRDIVRDADADDSRGFWEYALGDDGAEKIENWDFAKGFIEGALSVWDSVKDEV